MYDNIVIDWYEEPNALASPGSHAGVIDNDARIKRIFNPDKYTVECYNKIYHTDKWHLVFYPWNSALTPPRCEKIYDVYHTGNICNTAIRFAFPIIEKFNSCFVCTDYGSHRGVSHQQKLLLNAQSKISITHCLLQWPERCNAIADQYPDHKGLSKRYETDGKVPQFKTRILEAVASKSLVLNYFDPWNEIEDYFEPNKDFLYWFNEKDLEEKIHHVLAHYDEYQPMIENAYNKLMGNFTTRHYFEKFLLLL
jgi:hypothetical protein